MKTSYKERERGVAILFAILMTSMLLLVTIGISSIAFKENIFSLEARDSSRAFFAADTGIECTLYLDSIHTFPDAASADCQNVTFAIGEAPPTAKFFIPFQTLGTCAAVNINRDELYDPDGPGPLPAASYTDIESYGYNSVFGTFCYNYNTPPVRIVTRALRVRYPTAP